jgi:hypothetical protein
MIKKYKTADYTDEHRLKNRKAKSKTEKQIKKQD